MCERHVRARIRPTHIEPIRILEVLRIAIRRRQRHCYEVASSNRDFT